MLARALPLASSLLLLTACGAALDPADDPGSPAPQRSAPLPRPSSPPIEQRPAWISAAPSRALIVPADGQPVWIGVWIDAPAAPAARARPPMALSLVIDTSGSMAGPKIENARLAASSLLEGLSPGDLVSIDTFATEVRALAPPTIVGAGSLAPLFEAVRGLSSGGGTNLHGGLLAGEAHAAASARHALRRLIMISDGQANIGPASPELLGDVASRGTELGVQVSAIGVGLDYDEHTLGELARRSSGRLYHLEQPSELAAILDQEVRLLADTVATGATLELSPGEGVELLSAELVDARREGAALRVDLGALYAGQRRELLFQVRVRGEPGQEIELGKARLVYQSGGEQAGWAAQSTPVRGQISLDRAASAASGDARVLAAVARHEAAVAQRKAAEMLNQGRQQEAVQVLQDAEIQVSAAARASGDGAERQRLEAQAGRINFSKKSAQAASTPQEARATALDSYGYSFSDDGLAAPIKLDRAPVRK